MVQPVHSCYEDLSYLHTGWRWSTYRRSNRRSCSALDLQSDEGLRVTIRNVLNICLAKIGVGFYYCTVDVQSHGAGKGATKQRSSARLFGY